MGIFRVVPIEGQPACPPIEPVEARLRPDPQVSVPVAQHGPDHVVGKGGWVADAVRVVDERWRLPNDGGEPALGADPHHAFRILEQREHRVVRQSVRLRGIAAVPDEPPGLGVELQQDPCPSCTARGLRRGPRRARSLR